MLLFPLTLRCPLAPLCFATHAPVPVLCNPCPCVPWLLGQNLDNTEGIQQTKGLFAGIVVMTSLLIVFGIVMVISYYRAQGTNTAHAIPHQTVPYTA